jgi:hypothetical protein
VVHVESDIGVLFLSDMSDALFTGDIGTRPGNHNVVTHKPIAR